MALKRVLVGERAQLSGAQVRKEIRKARTIKGFRMKPGYIYTVVRAISARINQNYDGWPPEELKKSYHTFIGKPVFVNHENYDPKLARGVVVAARYVDANPNDQYIEVIQEIDARAFPKLAHEIKTGGLDSVSMGAEAAFTICSYCKHKATDESDMCDHVMFHKGEHLRKFNRRTGKVDDILVYEKCMKLSFFELSYVFDPADETAVASKVLVASTKHGVSSCPPGAICDKPEELGSTMGGTDTGGASGTPASSTSTSTSDSSGGGDTTTNSAGLQPAAAALNDLLMEKFPGSTIGGVREDSMPYHPEGRALDYMTTDPERQQAVIDLAFQNGAEHVISNGQIIYNGGRAEPYSGDNPHTDHVHINFASGASPPAASKDIITASFERQVLRTAGYKDAGATEDYLEWQRKVESGEIEPERGPKQYMPNKSLQDWAQRMRKRQSGFEAAVLRAAGYKVAGPAFDPMSSQRTQVANTIATYEKAHGYLDDEGADPNHETLDYGAGLGLSGAHPGLRFDTFEPHPKEHYQPTYTDPEKIPEGGYGRVMSLNVLNVVPPDVRDHIVAGIGRALAPGGHAVITTRGRDVMTTKGRPPDPSKGEPDEPMAMVNEDPKTGEKWYQKGFTHNELAQYVADTLPDDYTVYPVHGLGAAGCHVIRHPGPGNPIPRKPPLEHTAAKTAIYNDLDKFPEDAAHYSLPEGHAIHVFPPTKGLPGISGVMPDKPGESRYEWVHTHHGEPINSGMATTHGEAAQQGKDSYEAERSVSHLMEPGWDPDRDPKDPRYDPRFSARQRAAQTFERRVLMAAGYKTAGWQQDPTGASWERAGGDIGSLPGYGGGSRNDYGAGPEEYHEGWKEQNPGEHPEESPYFEDLHPKAQQRELDEHDFSQAGHPGYGGPLGPEHSMENTEAFKNYRPGPNPYEAKVLKTAGYKMAWGETEAPPEVDTLRPEGSAPEDDNDDYHEFVNPADTEFANNNESPQELLTPDLEQAGNIDREQDQQQGQVPPGAPQQAPGGPPAPQPQMMTLQIPMPPQQGQMPMQAFARRVLAVAGYKLAEHDGDDDDEPDAPPVKPELNPGEPDVPAGTKGTLTQKPAAPGAATADHTEHTHAGTPAVGAGGAALEDWQLPGGTNPTDPHGLAMPLAESQVGQYSPTLDRNVTTEDVSGAANQGAIGAWNSANPTNVFDPEMKYDPASMERGVQHVFTKPGDPGAIPPPPAPGQQEGALSPDIAAQYGPPPGSPTGTVTPDAAAPPPPPPSGDVAGTPPPPETTASRQLNAYFNQYFGTNVETATLENSRGVSGTSRKPRKGTTMGRTSTLAQRGKVASQGKRQHFAEGPYTDGGPFGEDGTQGEQEETFVTQVPAAEPVDMPDDDTHNISNTEGNLVARVNKGRQQLLRDAQQLAAFQAGKKAGRRRTAESISMERADKYDPQVQTGPAANNLLHGEYDAVGESPEETQPNDSREASRSLQAFEAFDKWLHQATGRQARHLTEVGIKRAANEWAKRARVDARVLFPALGIVLRQARKNEAAIKAATKAKKGAGMRRRAVDLEVAAPDGRVDVEAPVENVTDAEAQESQFDLTDFGHNAGDGVADPDLDTDSQFWAPGEGDKGANEKESRRKKATPKAGGILAVRCAEAYIRAGLEPNTQERKYQLAGLFEGMNRGAVQRDIALLERVAQLQTQTRQKVASGRTRGAGQAIPPGLTQGGTQRSASTRRMSANDPQNDALLFG